MPNDEREAALRGLGPREPLGYRLEKVDAELRAAIEPSEMLIGEPLKVALDTSPAAEPMVVHALTMRGVRPGRKWLKRARDIASDVAEDVALAAIASVVDAIAAMDRPVDPEDSDAVRGLVCFGSCWPTPAMAAALGRALRVFAAKIPPIGVRCQKGFSGATWALGEMGTFEALASLSVARARVRQTALSKLIDNTLAQAASAQGITREELEERLTPDFGFGENRVARWDFGPDHAELALDARARAEVRWFASGKLVASPSLRMKANYADEIAALKAQKKELETVVAAVRQRLDGLFLSRRRIPYAEWRERYADHPVVGAFARRLIWEFRMMDEVAAGVPLDGGDPVGPDGNALPFDLSDSTVHLWHPIDATDEEVAAWRDALFQWELTQPFKQAYREVYVLTPAEERTNVYSNRFAAQIIRQHQAAALMRERGWVAKLKSYFNRDNDQPYRTLAEWNLTAELFIEEVGDQMSDAGFALYVSTDQVRFRRGQVSVRLVDVPGIVLSEIFRDVDLFVGVASIGNDPNWMDQGAREVAPAEQWHDYSFGELSAMAETRRDVLARLLPRLKIAKAAKIDGRFLRVRGRRHKYKIHLGSGNILIEPADRYLCIVPDSRTESDAIGFLPFEGDRTLSIILSKAMMLAEDHKITDATILRQL